MPKFYILSHNWFVHSESDITYEVVSAKTKQEARGIAANTKFLIDRQFSHGDTYVIGLDDFSKREKLGWFKSEIVTSDRIAVNHQFFNSKSEWNSKPLKSPRELEAVAEADDFEKSCRTGLKSPGVSIILRKSKLLELEEIK